MGKVDNVRKKNSPLHWKVMEWGTRSAHQADKNVSSKLLPGPKGNTVHPGDNVVTRFHKSMESLQLGQLEFPKKTFFDQ